MAVVSFLSNPLKINGLSVTEDLSCVCLYVCFTLTKALPLRRHRSRSRRRALLITHTFIIYNTILTSKHLNLIFVEVVRYLPYLSDFKGVKLSEDWCRYTPVTIPINKRKVVTSGNSSLVSDPFTQDGSAMCCGTKSAKHFSLFMTMRLSHWPSLTTGRSTSRLISIFITYNISGRLVSIILAVTFHKQTQSSCCTVCLACGLCITSQTIWYG